MRESRTLWASADWGKWSLGKIWRKFGIESELMRLWEPDLNSGGVRIEVWAEISNGRSHKRSRWGADSRNRKNVQLLSLLESLSLEIRLFVAGKPGKGKPETETTRIKVQALSQWKTFPSRNCNADPRRRILPTPTVSLPSRKLIEEINLKGWIL